VASAPAVPREQASYPARAAVILVQAD